MLRRRWKLSDYLPRLVDTEHGLTDDPDSYNRERKRAWIRRVRWCTLFGVLLLVASLILLCWATGWLTYLHGQYQISKFRPALNVTWPHSTATQLQCLAATRQLLLHNQSLTCIGALDAYCFLKIMIWRDPTSGTITEWINPWWEPVPGGTLLTYLESSPWCRHGERTNIARWDRIRVWHVDTTRMDLQWTTHILHDEQAACVQHWIDLFAGKCS